MMECDKIKQVNFYH